MNRWSLLGLVAALALLTLLFQMSSRRGSFAEAGSSYRARPDGARGLYLLAESAGLRVRRLHTALDRIEFDGVLVVVDAPGSSACAITAVGTGSDTGPDTSDDIAAGEAAADGAGVPVEGADAPGADGEGSDGLGADERDAPGVVSAPHDADGEVETPPAGTTGEDGEADQDAWAGGKTVSHDMRLSVRECRAVLDWVEGGGRLVHVTAAADDGLLALAGIHFEPLPSPEEGEDDAAQEAASSGALPPPSAQEARADDPPTRTLVPGQPTRFTQGVRTVVASVAGHLRAEETGAIHLLEESEQDGVAVALAVPRGAGWIVAVAAPDLASNRRLASADNATFWLGLLSTLAAGQAVVFDEYHHGFIGRRGLMGYVTGRGLSASLFQLLFAFFVAALAGRRFGDPAVHPRPTLRAKEDYLSGMAHLYRDGGHTGYAAKRIARRALRRASSHHNATVAAATSALQASLHRLSSNPTESELRTVAAAARGLYAALHRRGRRGDE